MAHQMSAVLPLSASLIITLLCNIESTSYDARTKEKRESIEPIYHYKGNEAFLINTTGCYIPNYGKKLVFLEAVHHKITCRPRAVFISQKYQGWQKKVLVFKIDRDKMRLYSKGIEKYECCYSFATRSDESGYEDSQLSYSQCKIFQSGSKAELSEEVIIVKCFTLFILPNKTMPRIIYEDAYTFVKKQKINSMRYNEKSWNVLLIGIDTMSRARIISAMPKLVKYLKTHGWLDYKGYQKIASNTFPNLVSLMTGKKLTTIDSACSLGMHTCNDLLAWSTFRKNGYFTAFGEDNTWLPHTFSKYDGFKTPPTDHYMRPFFLTGERKVGNVICTKHEPSAINIFNYAFDFSTTYIKDKFFGTFWINTFSHQTDYLPSLYENDTKHFFEKLSQTGILDSTFIILLSDHGNRFGRNRLKMESFYEERLPMLFIWVPKEFRKVYKKQYYNLQLNQNRLVTPYDLYLTLVKISNMARSVDRASEACPLCRALFEEILPSRTCAEAGVSDKWCTCHAMKAVNTLTDIDAVNSVQFLVSYIQNYTLFIETKDCTTCHPLSLDTIHRIHSYVNQNNQKCYIIALQMAVNETANTRMKVVTKMSYEATVLINDGKISILDSIEPISAYHSRSHCITHSHDYGFCICKPVNCYTFK